MPMQFNHVHSLLDARNRNVMTMPQISNSNCSVNIHFHMK